MRGAPRPVVDGSSASLTKEAGGPAEDLPHGSSGPTAEGTREAPLVVVSPHPDDAAYSVGGLLAGGFHRGPILAVTMFTRSKAFQYGEPGLSRAIGRPLDLASSQPRVNRIRERVSTLEVSRLRKLEDVWYMKAVNAQRVDMNLTDAPLRGYGWSPWVSDSSNARDDPFTRAVSVSMRGIVTSFLGANSAKKTQEPARTSGRCIMLLPLALGGHVDHVVAREACAELVREHTGVYYEDLPYAESLSEDEIQRRVRGFDPTLEPHLLAIGDSLAKKVENLGRYKTQVGERELARVVGYAKRVGGARGPCERLWYGHITDGDGAGWLRHFR